MARRPVSPTLATARPYCAHSHGLALGLVLLAYGFSGGVTAFQCAHVPSLHFRVAVTTAPNARPGMFAIAHTRPRSPRASSATKPCRLCSNSRGVCRRSPDRPCAPRVRIGVTHAPQATAAHRTAGVAGARRRPRPARLRRRAPADLASGRDIFRHGTFGDEQLWTGALRCTRPLRNSTRDRAIGRRRSISRCCRPRRRRSRPGRWIRRARR